MGIIHENQDGALGFVEGRLELSPKIGPKKKVAVRTQAKGIKCGSERLAQRHDFGVDEILGTCSRTSGWHHPVADRKHDSPIQ